MAIVTYISYAIVLYIIFICIFASREKRFISRQYHTLRFCTEQPCKCIDSKTDNVKLSNTKDTGAVVEAQLHKYGLVEVFWSSIVCNGGFSAFFIITSRGSGTGNLGSRSTVDNSSQQSQHRRSKSLSSTWGRESYVLGFRISS